MDFKTKTRKEVEDSYKIDFKKFYTNEKEFEKDIELVNKNLPIIESFKSKVVENSDTLYKLLELFFKTIVVIEKVYVYGSLMNSVDESDINGKNLYAKAYDLYNDFANRTAFIKIEIIEADSKKIHQFLNENKDLKLYDYYLTEMIRSKEHTLSEKEEILTNEMSMLASNYNKIRDTLFFEDIKYGEIKDSNGNKIEITNQNIGQLLKDKDRNLRKRAYKRYTESRSLFQSTFASALNSKLKYDLKISKILNYDSPLDMSLFDYNLNKKVIDNYLSVADEYHDLYGKYNLLLKKSLGYNKLYAYDLSADSFEESKKEYSVEDAQKMLLQAFSTYGKQYTDYLQNIFDNRMVDYIPTKNKATGAFSIGAYLVGSIAFVNFFGKLENISTLAHELGHAVHSRYTFDNNHPVYADSSFLLVEIASITNEIIFSDYILKTSKNNLEKYKLLKSLLDVLLGNYFLVAGRMELQNKLYKLLEDGKTITADILNDTNLEVSKRFELNNVDVLEYDKNIWMKVSHYYNLYYNYQYAIGVSVAAYFSSKILKNGGIEANNYLEFLKNSGRKDPYDLLKDYNVDLMNRKTFEVITDVIKEKLVEFEAVINELKKEER
ncbi:MAG: M3 family metallopeptidase [Bacilli bacterium]|nr:M3 family metallopeptidase [Bacilli bacterium]